jgi:glycerol-3-phosphate acyltransferase PlsY
MSATLLFSSAHYLPPQANATWPYLSLIGLFLAAIIAGYLLGSLPFGLWIGKTFTGKDVRDVGSGRIGMTNVMRTAGKKAAVISLALDMSKSALSVLCAALIFSSDYAKSINAVPWRESAMAITALAAIAGHSWSVFLQFKGGRGVATFIGGLLVMYWQAGVIGGILTLVIGFRTKYMSMGSIIGAVTAFIVLMSFSILQITFFGPPPAFVYVLYAMAGAIFIYVIHRDNIIRLFSGTERRIGDKKDDSSKPSATF